MHKGEDGPSHQQRSCCGACWARFHSRVSAGGDDAEEDADSDDDSNKIIFAQNRARARTAGAVVHLRTAGSAGCVASSKRCWIFCSTSRCFSGNPNTSLNHVVEDIVTKSPPARLAMGRWCRAQKQQQQQQQKQQQAGKRSAQQPSTRCGWGHGPGCRRGLAAACGWEIARKSKIPTPLVADGRTHTRRASSNLDLLQYCNTPGAPGHH
jgi:hypothetical protein